MSIIDEYCKIHGSVVEPYSCILNQTDIDANKNKFYIMQIIQSKTELFVFIRYGRIGELGKSSIEKYCNQDDAICFFKKQFKTKTGNEFGTPFVKKSGKYFLTEIEKPKLDEIKDENKSVDVDIKNLDDDLDDAIKFFLDLISNEKMLSDTLIKLNIDPKKMPLGKISQSQMDKATELLKKLKIMVDEEALSGKKINENELKQLSSDYYTLLPFSCGRRKPPILNNSELVDKNVDLIDELKNVHITYSITKNVINNINKLTNVYTQLNATLKILNKTTQIYTELEKYVANTHAPTHHCKLQVMEIYEINKSTDAIYDNYTKNMENKMLLFHGSPIANWCSIIKNGLLLDPSKLGVKITGKMFGYGIYWANSISKSFNYCCSENSNNIAVLAIGEVALGNMHELYNSDCTLSQIRLDALNKNSTWGKGGSTPEYITMVDGVGIPNGKLKNNNNSTNYSLLYDEFIIYNSKQYKIKYLIVIKNTVK